MEHDHPHSLDFLRTDITNLNNFFGSYTKLAPLRAIFDYVTDPGAVEVDKVFVRAEGATAESEAQDDAVFRQSYIPTRLTDVLDYERDQDKMLDGDTHDVRCFWLLSAFGLIVTGDSFYIRR